MWVVKQIIEWMIGKVFKAYYKRLGYAGLFLLALIIECIGLAIYRGEALGMVDIHKSVTIITEAFPKPEQNDPDRYEYELALENHGSRVNRIHSVAVTNQEGDRISGEVIGVYRTAERWAGVGSEEAIYVPAGSQAKVTVALDKSSLERKETEKLIFTIGLTGEEFSFETEFPR